MKIACTSVVAFLGGLFIFTTALMFMFPTVSKDEPPPTVRAKMHYTGLSYWSGTEWKRSYDERWEVVLALPAGGSTTISVSKDVWEKLHYGDEYTERR